MIRIGERERKYVEEVLTTEFRSSSGCSMMSRLEKAFAKKFKVKYVLAHNNGTATLHSAMYAAGIRPGDEVIVPPLTMASTSMAVMQHDAVPVFADVCENTFQIDPVAIKKLITPRTKAIIAVSLYGLSPDMDLIMKIAKKHKLVVIEDSAQCFLGKYKGRLVGSIGHLSSFSFQASKHMSAGEGGVLCTNNQKMAERIRRFSVLGYADVSAKQGKITKDDIQNPNYNRHVCLGYNYRMPELCSAVALGQLEHLEELVQRRIDVANLFLKQMRGVDWLIPQATPVGYKNSYWSLAVRLVHPRIKWFDFRKKFMELGGDGIYAAWKLTYLELMFQHLNFSGKEEIYKKLYSDKMQKYQIGLCPIAEKIQPQILAFKTGYWDWSKAEIQAEILNKTIKFYEK
ncbi:DegT/DnrJ/EryC1/StrS family aminotransferase [Candidatus Falkowbacteria bacterium CG10_big_fil_rev_8_21_14_0_10_43_11]|uniref:DegT/DnrJ/EryC1/StrS family aminotransferase n=1 Tax=Candidatus Falkowbacteria bacterium CG10_big_fil_rev_8_21_14_0_10_43_11 TaxID=1974568 RepID=A0A2M6WL77_9BACT|nr:MAG: DegT/DnrJ/EryC1/StrS family aminotransferase [Candidatus Falkowbacteria bacterium CG10_big_fil_rev_8_21_14_0_10_43_11]